MHANAKNMIGVRIKMCFMPKIAEPGGVINGGVGVMLGEPSEPAPSYPPMIGRAFLCKHVNEGITQVLKHI